MYAQILVARYRFLTFWKMVALVAGCWVPYPAILGTILGTMVLSTMVSGTMVLGTTWESFQRAQVGDFHVWDKTQAET